MKKRVYIVPHSHWDREWYFTIEDSNLLLSENLPYLMDVLEEDDKFKSYTFDAQGSVVDEFLRFVPEERDRLIKNIEEKRIHVGPWYTQTDSLLVNKESIVRNLLYGIKTCEKHGGYMNLGYLPDIFGQNAYLPSIFQDFGIEDAILQRGIYTDRLKNNLNFKWKSPDGRSVRANNIYLGYGPGKFLDSSDKYIEEKLLPMLEKLEELNTSTDNILLPSGGDQVLVRKEFPRIIDELNQKLDKYEFVLSDYETFMKDTWLGKGFDNTIDGELRATQKSRIHRTIGSQRYDIKLLNSKVENTILKVLEPLALIGQELGIKYPKSWIEHMWKKLFDVHAHDSIGGCNSDDTNRKIIERLDEVDKIAKGIINITKKKITYAISKSLGIKNLVTVFNTDIVKKDMLTKMAIFTKDKNFSLETIDGDTVSYEVLDKEYLSGGRQVIVTAQGEKEVEVPGYYRTEVLLDIKEMPSLGYLCYQVVEGGAEVGGFEVEEVNFIENDYFKLSFEGDKLNLYNKETKTTLEDFIGFEDSGDYGDSYDYSPLAGDKAIYLNHQLVKVEKTKTIERVYIRSKAMLPRDIDNRIGRSELQEFAIDTILELHKREEFVRVKHMCDNNILDHRLRAVIDTGMTSIKTSYSDSGYSLIAHEVEDRYPNWRELGFVERPTPIYNMENMLMVEEGNKKLAIFVEGIKEYEVVKDKVALTLFRSVGLLGRNNLEWRPGRASGINNKVVYTPDAQMQGEIVFEYAICITSNMDIADIYRSCNRWLDKGVSYQKQDLNTFEERVERFSIPSLDKRLNKKMSLLEIDNKDLFLSCCKNAYGKGGKVIRVFNPSNVAKKFNFVENNLGRVYISSMKEDKLELIDESIRVEAKSFVTILID